MERLFTPWRHEYVTAGVKSEGCVMCQAAEGQAEDLVVHRGSTAFVVMNLYPYNSGHVMVAPVRHLGSLIDATPDELGEIMTLARQVEAAFREEYHPDGINIGMNLGKAAGAGVADHIHLHLVPRWNGDTNFMTVTASARVLPEAPAESCARLRRRFQP
jgi:ATP adenylyltransferase